MRRAISVANVIDARFQTLNLEGEWLEAIGKPEASGTWFIFGPPKNGKTTFAMMLAKVLAGFRKIAYDSVEEGLSLTIQMALERTGMVDVGSRFVLLDKEDIGDLVTRLKKHKSPDIVVIDSVQFMDLKWSEYKQLKAEFPGKLFIYISHIDGSKPDGLTARKIWRDASVVFRVQGFRAIPVSRYGGGQYIDINKEKADAYWGLESIKE